MDLNVFSNQLYFNTLREVEKDGKTWLVVNGVPIVEGVLGGYLVPFDEFGSYPYDWNDMPLVLNHPQANNGSARVTSPDVPVVGRFHNTNADATARRLVGEYWLDKLAFLATNDGQTIYEKMLKGQPIEVSTGYYAPGTIFEHGKHKGTEYMGIHKNIHPDHIAILTDGIGNCSLMDGCGMNRNSTDTVLNCDTCSLRAVANMTGNLPAGGKKIYEKVYKACIDKGDDKETASKKAWGAVKKAGWMMGKDGGWMMQNEAGDTYENSAMIALMIPDALKVSLQSKYPFIDDATRDDLHITITYLGNALTLDKEKAVKALFSAAARTSPIQIKMQGIARFVSGNETDPVVVTFDSPELGKLYRAVCNGLADMKIPYHDEHGFIPHMTLGYIGKNEPMPLDTIEPMEMNFAQITLVIGDEFIPATLEGYGEASYINQQSANQLRGWIAKATHFTKEFLMQNKQLSAFLQSLGFKNVSIEDKGDEGLSLKLEGSGDEKALEGLVQLNSVVQNSGGPDELAKTFETLKGLPATLAAMQTQMNETATLVKNVSAFAASVAGKEEATKKAVVEGLVKNKACPFDEATLNSMTLDVLQKLDTSYQAVDYSGLGFGITQNAGENEKPLALPQGYFAPVTPAKQEARND